MAMGETELRAFVEWVRPRKGWNWLVLGELSAGNAKLLLELVEPGKLTYVTEGDAASKTFADERVVVTTDEYAGLRSVSGLIDATLGLGALEDAQDPARVVAAMARVTRLYGVMGEIEAPAVGRRTLWNWWLDARLNDVSSRETESAVMVRGTR